MPRMNSRQSTTNSDSEPPRSGWQPDRLIDAASFGAQTSRRTCDRCNHALRWIHVLVHRDWPHEMRVGCCCAVRLCDDYDAEAAERHELNRVLRRQRFLGSEKWKRSRKGNLWRRYCSKTVTIFSRPLGGYGFSISFGKHTEKPEYSNLPYMNASEAMAGAFDRLDGQRGGNDNA